MSTQKTTRTEAAGLRPFMLPRIITYVLITAASPCFGATSAAVRNATAEKDKTEASTNPHFGKYQASIPAGATGDEMTTVAPAGESRTLEVETATAIPDRPSDKGKVMWDGKKTNPTRFKGRSDGWGAVYDVRGIYKIAAAVAGKGKDPDEWFSHFKAEPRIVLEINGDGDEDNTIMLGANPGALTVKLLDVQSGSYTVALSCSAANKVTIGTVPALTSQNGYTATVDLTGDNEGEAPISGTCTGLTPGQTVGRVLGLAVDAVTFAAAPNDGSYYAVYVDGTETAYPSPHWKRERTATGTVPFAQSPVCYLKESKMRVTVTLKGTSDLSGDIWISGVSDGATFAATKGTISADKKSVTVTLDAATILRNGVDYFDPMTIEWKWNTTGTGTFTSAGSTANQVYVTLGTPAMGTTAKLWHTLVHIGCKKSEHQTNPTLVPGEIWEEFADRYVTRVDGHLLTYYADFKTTNILTGTLLANNDASCSAWAKFYVDVLKAVGYTQTGDNLVGLQVKSQYVGTLRFLVDKWIIPTTGGLSGDDNYPYLNVRALANPADPGSWIGTTGYMWKFSQCTDVRGIAGQGVANPASSFDSHTFTCINGIYYDPSYGRTYPSTIWPLGNIINYFVRYKASSPVSEQVVNTDLNGDGDKNDTISPCPSSLFSNKVDASDLVKYIDTGSLKY